MDDVEFTCVAEALMEDLRAEAHRMRESAGHSGAYHDGGAGDLEAKIRAFDCGVRHTFPTEWEQRARDIKRRLDQDRQRMAHPTEYATYERLKRLFEGEEGER